MAAQDRIQVVIYGRTYQLVGADAVRTRELARKVDETMRRFSENMPGAESYQLAILAALHLADKLARVRDEFATYRSDVGDSADRLLEVLENGLREELQTPAAAAADNPPGVAAGDTPADVETHPDDTNTAEPVGGGPDELPVDIPEAL